MSNDGNPVDPGEYTDEETADGRTTRNGAEIAGQYEDSELDESRSTAVEAGEQGGYTDVDRDGDR